MDAGSLPEKVKRAEPMLRNWELILEERHANREEVLIEFVKQSKEIDYLARRRNPLFLPRWSNMLKGSCI